MWNDDWNIDHIRWSQRCPPKDGQHYKKTDFTSFTWFQFLFALQLQKIREHWPRCLKIKMVLLSGWCSLHWTVQSGIHHTGVLSFGLQTNHWWFFSWSICAKRTLGHDRIWRFQPGKLRSRVQILVAPLLEQSCKLYNQRINNNN